MLSSCTDNFLALSTMGWLHGKSGFAQRRGSAIGGTSIAASAVRPFGVLRGLRLNLLGPDDTNPRHGKQQSGSSMPVVACVDE